MDNTQCEIYHNAVSQKTIFFFLYPDHEWKQKAFVVFSSRCFVSNIFFSTKKLSLCVPKKGEKISASLPPSPTCPKLSKCPFLSSGRLPPKKHKEFLVLLHIIDNPKTISWTCFPKKNPAKLANKKIYKYFLNCALNA